MSAKIDDFNLTTAPRKNFFLLVALTLWLALWGGGLFVVASALLRGLTKEAGFFAVFFILVWLAGWLLGGGLALYGLFWTLFGTETIVATSERLTLTRRVCGYEQVRHYDAAKIRNLRLVEAEGMTDFLLSLRPFGIGNGLLTFDCGTTVNFVAGGDRAQAPELLAGLRAVISSRPEQEHV
jgi:hypothetical protein